MLEGLEIGEERLSAVSVLSKTKRLDASFYQSKLVLDQISAFGSVPLGNETSWITQGPNPKFIEEKGIPSLTGRNIARGFVAPEGADQVSILEYEELSRFQILKGDLFVTLKGAGSTGKVALLNSQFEGIFSRNIGLIRLEKSSVLSPGFLFAFLASRTGQKLIDRGVTGGTGQLTLPTDYLKYLQVPVPSPQLNSGISNLIGGSYSSLETSQHLQRDAEARLLSALNLDKWQPPNSLTYETSASTALSADRFDPEFFHPRIDDLFHRLGDRHQTIADVARLRKERFRPSATKFNYLEIGAVSKDGVVADSILDEDEAPSRATWRVHSRDIITSTVRPIRGLTAMIESHQENAVASSGFAVLEPVGISPELLLCYLKLPVICELMDLHTSASMYPAISVSDILNLPFQHPGENAEKEVIELLQEVRAQRRQSNALLERAKRAVEIAIEQDEETALAYLDGKHYVADELLPKLFGLTRHYVDLKTIQRTLEAEAIQYEDSTIQRYLHEWQKEGRLHDAGRGWYSDLPNTFVSDPYFEIIQTVESVLEEEFPLLDRTIWSTRDISAYFHHLPTRHATFLMVDRDAFEPVADALRNAALHVVIHPLGATAKKFQLKEVDTVILRPRLRSDHTESHSPIEQILVDFLHEIQKLELFEIEEYRNVVHNLATTHRINITALKRYAERRKIDPESILSAFL